MPRPLKHRTELRQLRDSLSILERKTITQALIADRLGVSTGLVNAIEAGTKSMSENLAHRVFLIFGVWLAPLPLERATEFGIDPIPHTPYSPFDPDGNGDLQKGMHIFRKLPGPEALTLRRLRALMGAAEETKTLPQVASAINDAITSIVEEFNLRESFITEIFVRRQFPS